MWQLATGNCLYSAITLRTRCDHDKYKNRTTLNRLKFPAAVVTFLSMLFSRYGRCILPLVLHSRSHLLAYSLWPQSKNVCVCVCRERKKHTENSIVQFVSLFRRTRSLSIVYRVSAKSMADRVAHHRRVLFKHHTHTHKQIAQDGWYNIYSVWFAFFYSFILLLVHDSLLKLMYTHQTKTDGGNKGTTEKNPHTTTTMGTTTTNWIVPPAKNTTSDFLKE